MERQTLLVEEVEKELIDHIIPFWKNMLDKEYGGYYGLLTDDLTLVKEGVKGGILNSRILWFFSNAYLLYKDGELLECARHAYDFLVNHLIDTSRGGIYWSVKHDGEVEDSTKHTYNQAFAIYALSSYYDASGDCYAKDLAIKLFEIIETKCRDGIGYGEAYDKNFVPALNEKLSENGIIAEKTMNTLLHIFEAYTELYRVTGLEEVAHRLYCILEIMKNKVFNKNQRRQEVFFDREMNTIFNLHSYGHDIESAWLIDLGCKILGNNDLTKRMNEMTQVLESSVFEQGFNGNYVMNEKEGQKVDRSCIWWVQAEAMIGYYNGYEKDHTKKEYLDAVFTVWDYVKKHIIDEREGSEWFWEVDEDGKTNPTRNILDMWKCPYHNGRMCFELIRRIKK